MTRTVFVNGDYLPEDEAIGVAVGLLVGVLRESAGRSRIADLVVRLAGLPPPAVLRDAPAPTVLAPYVRDARASVRQNIEGLLPAHLRYIGARCRAGKQVAAATVSARHRACFACGRQRRSYRMRNR